MATESDTETFMSTAYGGKLSRKSEHDTDRAAAAAMIKRKSEHDTDRAAAAAMIKIFIVFMIPAILEIEIQPQAQCP